MARRRCIHENIYEDARFIELPDQAKTLYTYYNLKADDDGLLNSSLVIMRMCNIDKQYHQMLIDKGFIYEFESGVIVIIHWWLHNNLQKDRYHETIYEEEKARLVLDGKRYRIDGYDICLQDDNILITEHNETKIKELNKKKKNKNNIFENKAEISNDEFLKKFR